MSVIDVESLAACNELSSCLTGRMPDRPDRAPRRRVSRATAPRDGRVRWIQLDDDGIVDEVTVKRVAGGEPAVLTQAERDAAAREIVRRGGTPTELATRLHLNGITANAWYETITGHPYPNSRAAVRERTLAAVRAVLDEGGDLPEIAARLSVTQESARRLYVAATGHRHPNCMAARRERRIAAARAILDGGGSVTDISARLRIGGSDARNLYLAATGHLPPRRGTRTREQDQ